MVGDRIQAWPRGWVSQNPPVIEKIGQNPPCPAKPDPPPPHRRAKRGDKILGFFRDFLRKI